MFSGIIEEYFPTLVEECCVCMLNFFNSRSIRKKKVITYKIDKNNSQEK